MGRFTDIDLIATADVVDEYGNWTTVETKRTVYAEERSVGMTEFYQGYAVGFKPEVKFVLSNFADYQGEQLVEYVPFLGNPDHPIRLTILRTYNSGDTLELTCYRGVETPHPEEPEPEVIDNANTEEPNEDTGEERQDGSDV